MRPRSRCAWRTACRSMSSTWTTRTTSPGSSPASRSVRSSRRPRREGRARAFALSSGGDGGEWPAMTLLDDLLEDARERMHKSVEATASELGTVRTGRASPTLLDRIHVDYYGTQTPLKQLATISAPEARLLTIQPFDSTAIKAIEK